MDNLMNSNYCSRKIQIRAKKKLRELIDSYYFYLFSGPVNIQENQAIFNNIGESDFIIIDKYGEKIENNDFLILSFQRTIIVILESLLSMLEPMFSDKLEFTFYLLHCKKEIFNQEMQNRFKFVECNEFIEEETEGFNDEFYNFKISNFPYHQMYLNIKSCISRYLIQQSYIKLNKQQKINFSKDFHIESFKEKQFKIEDWNADDFIELKILGSGIASNVILVYEIESKSLFAIKIFFHDTNKEKLKLINREYNNYLNIDYPLLPKFYGIYKNENAHYLKIQFINGTEVNEIKTIDLSFDDKIIILLQVMLIINYLHKKGLVYRDLKPNNIIIDENKNVFLIDFDRMLKISDKINDINEFTMDFGSIYVAPEVNNGIISYENDIYSLGMFINFILFNEESTQKNMLTNICEKCCDNNINNRPSITEVILEFIVAFSSQINNSLIKNIPELQYFQGLLYYEGKYIAQDIDKSIYYFSLAANQNHLEAQYYFQLLEYEKKYNIQELSFINIPKNYISFDKNVSDILKRIYSKFTFLYLPLLIINETNNLEKIEEYLFNYFRDFKFISYKLTNSNETFINKENASSCFKIENNSQKQKVNVIMCVEGKCSIMEKINFSMIKMIINKLKEHHIQMINVSVNFEKNAKEEFNAHEEINNFTNYFQENIKNNNFVDYTIRPILGFLIRRYFYPTNYFKDPSFFSFGQTNQSKEQEMRNNLISALNSDDKSQFYQNLYLLLTKVNEVKKQEIKISKEQVFQMNDFVVLRTLHKTEKSCFYLAIHLKSLYVFALKILQCSDKKNEKIEYEAFFHEYYSHRCFTKFYGILKERKEKIGFVYEYMCNDSLKSLIENHSDRIDDLYKLMTINRLFQGIEYYYQNSLTNYRFNPSNILVDHDFIPYISDFSSIINALNTTQNDQADTLSNFCLYSFGQIINFLFKPNSQNTTILQASKNIQNIHQLCVKFDTNRSSKHQQIKCMIINEINSFDHIEHFLVTEKSKYLSLNVIQYLYESLFINDEFGTFCLNVFSLKRLFSLKIENNISQLFLSLGILYYNGFIAKQNNAKASEYFELSALQNNSDALVYLGDLYFNGTGVKKDYLRAIKYFNLSAEQNNPKAFYNLGLLYFIGHGVIIQNYNKAREYFELSALQNYPDSFLYLGLIYFNGYGVDKDYFKAREYFQLSADQKNYKAFIHLRKIHSYGYPVNKIYLSNENDDDSYLYLHKGMQCENRNGSRHNYMNAIKYYELAAQKNNPKAFYNLGYLYYYGLGVNQDYMKAKEYFELAAQQNDSNALYYLGKYYSNDNVGEKDYLKAIEYYESSLNQNNSKVILSLDIHSSEEYGIVEEGLVCIGYKKLQKQVDSLSDYNMGMIFLYGIKNLKDYSKAKYYFELAAKKNHSGALFHLGYIYSFGFGVEKNYLKAKKYYELSAQQNDQFALYNLGIMYYNGFGVKKDYIKAKEYYELAAKQNNPYALLNLGSFYLLGLGVNRDDLKAKHYFELAAKHNITGAYHNLGIIYYKGYGIPKDCLRAIKYFELSAKEKYTDSLLNLACIYYNGDGVKQNYLKCIKYFESAAEQNNSFALFNLGVLYFKGVGVEQDYLKAKHYFELSGKLNNHFSLFCLGYIYENGYGIEKDYLKALTYYELSAKQNNSLALFHLGSIHSNNIKYLNITKAKDYLLKCYEIKDRNIRNVSPNHISSTIYTKYNFYRYRSANDLGLIYIIHDQNPEKASEYIKESAFLEYPYGQNNFGLLKQFYFNDIQNAEHFYIRSSSEHNFALAKFNLGHLKEEEGRQKESIEYFIDASEHEEDPLIFQNIIHYDERLEISKIFIICLANLKLAYYYFLNSEYEKSKKYFIKSFSKINIDTDNTFYRFQFKLNKKKGKHMFEYIKAFILLFPLFNLENQPYQNIQNSIKDFLSKNPDFKSGMNNDISMIEKDENIDYKYENASNEKIKEKDVMKKEYNQSINYEFNHKLFFNPGDLFDFILKDDEIKNIFLNAILDIIVSMENILYMPPYPILFGRINIDKSKSVTMPAIVYPNQKDINQEFYNGFGL